MLQAILNEHTRWDQETKYDLKAADGADGTNELHRTSRNVTEGGRCVGDQSGRIAKKEMTDGGRRRYAPSEFWKNRDE